MALDILSTDQLALLPSDPGIYKYYSKSGELIYVGKAKNIKKRVSSYFNKSSQHNRKTLKLIAEIKGVAYTIAHSEFDALLLENNLIKENQPKYNILLKDDKSFPYICVLNERFPRIISTRRLDPKKGEYYGPYSSVVAMNSVLDLLRKLYNIRTCKYNLSEKNINNRKFKVCLEYHIGNCKGPCEDRQSEQAYNNDIDQAKQILSSNTNIAKRHFKNEMNKHSATLNYEQAQKYKEKIELLDKFQNKTMVINSTDANIDVFSIITNEKSAYINYLRINNGTLNFTETTEIKKRLDEKDEEILSIYAYNMREKIGSLSKTILTNIPISSISEDTTNIVPKIGEKRKLVEMSLKNVLHFKKEKILQKEKIKDRLNESVKLLQKDLKLLSSPDHIECFDNSNIQGTNPVAAMVCFINGKPSKKNYRHYLIKTVKGPDDFASMYEVVKRRYSRLIDENKKLPKLILIDGGKGQLSSASQALKDLNVYGKIPIIGIAKKLEEIYFPEDQYPIHINKKSSSLRLLQQLRDEAHRFAISFHRKKRSSNAFKTDLEQINGIGRKTTDKLLQHFKSFKKIKEASLTDLLSLIGKSKANKVISHFREENK